MPIVKTIPVVKTEDAVSHPAFEEESRRTLVESLLDNLSVWTVVALSVGLLYLVWATLEILSHYVGAVPKVTP